MTASGYYPEAVTSGPEAIAAAQPSCYAGLILDIGLGLVDGLDVVRKIRARDLHAPIIMITASGSQELAIQAIGMGAQAYLLKPFDAGELQVVMENWFCRNERADV